MEAEASDMSKEEDELDTYSISDFLDNSIISTDEDFGLGDYRAGMLSPQTSTSTETFTMNPNLDSVWDAEPLPAAFELAQSAENLHQDWKTTSNFRCSAQRLLITIPKYDDIETLETNLRKDFPTLQAYIISKEKHQDGTYHLHCAFELKERLSIRGSKIKNLTGKQANIRVCTKKFGWVNAVKYVAGLVEKKENQNNEMVMHPPELLTTILDLEKHLQKTSTHKQSKGIGIEAFRRANAGETPYQIIEALPSLAIHVSNVINLVAMIKNHKEMEKKPTEKLISITHNDTREGMIIHNWLMTNYINPIIPRPHRSKALYIIGRPGCGKTELTLKLRRVMKIYYTTGEKQYMDEFENDKYDLILFDEFVGDSPLKFMNMVIDGAPMRIQQKCRISTMKEHNCPVLICSNMHPNKIYEKAPHQESVAAFIDRLHIIEVPDHLYVSDLINMNIE